MLCVLLAPIPVPMFTEVTKRNGTKVPFDSEKIVVAMRKAFAAENTPSDDLTLRQMADRVVAKLQARYEGKTETPTVEHVQDYVEETLMERGYFIVAKAYILYRFKQTEERKDEVVKDIEENRLKIKTEKGEEQFSREQMRAHIAQFTKGIESEIDIDSIITQLEREVYDGLRDL